MSVCCFTGHRDLPQGEVERLEKEAGMLIQQLIREGVTEFRVGGAVGFDMIMAELLLRLRDEEKQPIRIISMIPYTEWQRKWQSGEKNRQDRILQKSDEVKMIRNSFCKCVYMIRNHALADGAQFCIAYCTKPTGGSAWTVRFARQNGLKVFNLAEKSSTWKRERL